MTMVLVVTDDARTALNPEGPSVGLDHTFDEIGIPNPSTLTVMAIVPLNTFCTADRETAGGVPESTLTVTLVVEERYW